MGRSAPRVPPKPARYVTDGAGVLPTERADALNESLAAFDRETTNQILVWIARRVPPGTTPEELGTIAIRAWGVGTKEKSNGAVLFLFVDDRKSRIATGYGLEGELPDALCKRILADVARPYFSGGDYVGGVEAAVEAMRRAARGEDPFGSPIAPEPTVAKPVAPVTDLTGRLADEQKALFARRLESLRASTTARVFVLVGKGLPTGAASQKLFEAWKLAAGADDHVGVLFVDPAAISYHFEGTDGLERASAYGGFAWSAWKTSAEGKLRSGEVAAAVSELLDGFGRAFDEGGYVFRTDPEAERRRQASREAAEKADRRLLFVVASIATALGLGLVFVFVRAMRALSRRGRRAGIGSAASAWSSSDSSWSSASSSSWSDSSSSSSSSSSSDFSSGGGDSGGGGASDSW